MSSKKWGPERIEKQRAYFEKERTEKKGNFTEFVVRMYYLITKACTANDGLCCDTFTVKPYKVKFEIYEGIYDEPDHDYWRVIDDCVKYLKNMNYIKMRKSAEGRWLIYLNRPLDFLLPGEHEVYLKRYGITKTFRFLGE